MDDLADTLARLRAAWMAGRPALPHCPADWRQAADSEAALAAIAGQALLVAFQPVPGSTLTARPDVCALALPTVPDSVRARLRRLLAARRVPPLLHFLAARGYTMHPADWLPAKRDTALPALYAPWADWMAEGAPPPRQAVPKRDDSLAPELAALLSWAPLRLAFKPLKPAPRMARRQELFGKVTLEALAAALGTSPAALVQTAPAGPAETVAAFAAMVAATGPDSCCSTLLKAILDDPDSPLAAARPLAPQMPMQALLPTLFLRTEDAGFAFALELAGPALGQVPMRMLMDSPGYAALQAALAAAVTGPDPGRPAANALLTAGLYALGLLLDAPAAAQSLALCTTAGLSPADPRLEALHLNIALNPESSS